MTQNGKCAGVSGAPSERRSLESVRHGSNPIPHMVQVRFLDLTPEDRQRRDRDTERRAFARAQADPVTGRALAEQYTASAERCAKAARDMGRGGEVLARCAAMYAKRADAYRAGAAS